MGSVETRGWDLASFLLLDVVRYLTWALVGGLIAIGACCYGGHAAYLAWHEKGPPAPRRHQRAQERREAARGIAAIEAFLAEHATSPEPPPGPGHPRAPGPGRAPGEPDPDP